MLEPTEQQAEEQCWATVAVGLGAARMVCDSGTEREHESWKMVGYSPPPACNWRLYTQGVLLG